MDAIHDARQSLEIVMYGLTDDDLLNALVKKKREGATLKILLEHSPYKAENENRKAMAQLNLAQILWQGTIPPLRLIHQKTLIIDGRKAMIMTFNFTRSTFKTERNFALIIDDPARVNAVKKLFSADWNHVAIVNDSPDLIVSPDDSRTKILALIQKTKSSLNIYAQTLNDYKVVGALASAAKRGVSVKILTSTHMRDKQFRYLTRAGVIIRYSHPLFIHAKILIADEKTAVIGSINLTRASMDDNRELSVITRDPAVITPLLATFRQDWNSQPKDAANTWLKLLPDERSMKQALRRLNRFINENLH